jgi:hypothetical protein
MRSSNKSELRYAASTLFGLVCGGENRVLSMSYVLGVLAVLVVVLTGRNSTCTSSAFGVQTPSIGNGLNRVKKLSCDEVLATVSRPTVERDFLWYGLDDERPASVE